MQDRKEISSAEVIECGPYEDRTRPINCSAAAGDNSSDRTLSEAVTGRTDFTVHHRGNNSVRTGRSSCGQPDAPGSGVQSTPERFQSGADATGRVRWQMTGLGIESDQCALSPMVGTTGRVRLGRPARPVSSRKLGFVPNGYFLHGTYK
jgi:hypothetical protein